MRWLRPTAQISSVELDNLERAMSAFYSDPPATYHASAANAAKNWQEHVFHRRITDRVLLGYRVLDVGCGPAVACEQVVSKGGSYLGVDLAGDQLAANQRRCPGGRFVAMHWRDVPSLGASFDLVASFFVLEHIVRPQAFLAACAQCVAPLSS